MIEPERVRPGGSRMVRQTPFVWKDSFELGIPAIDGEHRQFFEILNRCVRAAGEGASPTTLALLLKELSTYADVHFCHEEEALDRVGYPELAQQKREHTQFLWELAALEARDAPTVLGALNLMRGWLTEHILGSDRRYVAWIEKDRPRRRWG
jgi:hemerythrin-like metal-binding protein